MFRRPFLFAIWMVLAASGMAQSYDLSQRTDLLGDLSQAHWYFHTGDNPAWASPGFDDSHWPLLSADSGWAEQGYAGYHGFAWYRIHLHLPRPEMQLALSPVHIDNAYRIYFDGAEVGGVGGMTPTSALLHRPYDFYELTAHGTDAVIAIRVWSFSFGAPYGVGGFHRSGDRLYGFASQGGFLIGSPEPIGQLNDYRKSRIPIDDGADFIVAGLMIPVCPFFVLLWSRQRESRVYLWFGISALFVPWTQSFLYGLFPNTLLNTRYVFLCTDLAYAALVVSSALVIYELVDRPRTRSLPWIIGGCVLVTLARLVGFLLPAIGFEPIAPATDRLLLVIALAGFYWLTFSLLISNWHMRDARRMFWPWLLRSIGSICNALVSLTFTAGLQHKFSSLPPVIRHPIPVDLGLIGLVTMVPVMCWVLLERFAEINNQHARQRSEVEAARRVQSILLRAYAARQSTWQIDSVYQPADEVGGDFFHTADLPNSTTRVVVGDVSGKGLGAALLVSAIVGALDMESRSNASPGEVLATLNTVLIDRGHGGFTTAVCAQLAADGSVILANAGHLAPYLNGEEVPLPSGLPLGIVASLDYEEVTRRLFPGDRITLLSDGVVEAQNQARELFGFERTRSLSTESANKIVQAAQDFGQEDDITVLTLTMAQPGPARA